MSAAAELAEIAARPLRGALAVLAANLPRRVWGRLDLPMEAAALVSALVVMIGGGILAVHFYLEFARQIASMVADSMLAAIEGGPSAGPMPAAITLVAFLVTPGGIVTGYLFFSGLLRFAAALTDEPVGDPLLTLGDRLWQAAAGRRRRDRARAARERLEGPAVPDVLLTGKDGGAPEAEFVVVSARVKEGWEKGVFVVTSEAWYRIGAPFDRRVAGGLRRFYPISEVKDLEVIRRSVHYELPRLTTGDPGGPR